MGGWRFIVAIVAIILVELCGSARAEVFSQTYVANPWNTDTQDHAYLDIPVELGFGVAAVDSIWVDVAGLSHPGSTVFYTGDIGMHVACWDLIVCRFVEDTRNGDCSAAVPAPDGAPDCAGAFFTPTGWAGVPFADEVHLAGIEQTSANPANFAVVTNVPDLGDLFLDGTATLRLQEFDSGWRGYACENGLPVIDTVTVHIAYDSALPITSRSWGNLKATFR